MQKTYVIMDMQQLWYQTEPNCETNCYLSFGDHLQSHNPTSLSQVLLVMISVVGSLLGSWAHCWWKLWMAVSNRSWLQWQVLMQWWVVAEVSSGCSQGQHNQLCLHAKCGLWAVRVQGVTDDLVLSWSISTMCPLLPATTSHQSPIYVCMYYDMWEGCVMNSWVETDML